MSIEIIDFLSQTRFNLYTSLNFSQIGNKGILRYKRRFIFNIKMLIQFYVFKIWSININWKKSRSSTSLWKNFLEFFFVVGPKENIFAKIIMINKKHLKFNLMHKYEGILKCDSPRESWLRHIQGECKMLLPKMIWYDDMHISSSI